MRLTPAQRAAVDLRAGDVLLAANAGSGKTRVLSERFVRAVVDDGVATGWTCVAAARWCRHAGAARVILAVPVGPVGLERRVGGVVDEVVVLETPEPYLAVGQAYVRFPQVSDDEVLRALRALREEEERQGERQPPR